MENDTEELHSQYEDEGGPSKSFLDHLEDLRWVLMKCAAAVAVGFLLCLFASPTLIKILTAPLDKANKLYYGGTPSVAFFMGTNQLGAFNFPTNQPNPFGTNLHSAYELTPVTVGSNVFMGLKPMTNQVELTSGRGVGLQILGPAAAFFLAVQMAIYGGIALASPFLFYFIGSFVFPALRMREKKYTYRGLSFGILLFLMGASFCYFILMPVALRASIQYPEWMGIKVTDFRAEEYVGFVCKFILGMGLGFELPIVLLVLVKIGILDYQTLKKMRRYMIIINLVLGAILTTPEVITQVLMAIPLQLLYEISVLIAWYWERKERKRRETIELE